ncbi:hypothetical protein I6F35_14040 [Bradyrhizobium sp. BRP22]|uniref:MauE/DoxX family redox-associated membrane protein n=1 Tax=Bradyrhizobium sp. BRP22 TaxID=2793821 RepID=UPI001CD63457|nr:MauE/DoxX family redox-associated membrane protein [Bradyrhizobium sp. BRP22]MCA1454329.1 hypothetical protein [Bradyrhizobium sp. BRP22]
MNWQLDPLLHLVATGFVIVVLARAVVEKLSAYGFFVANLQDYRLLPDALAPVAAPTLLIAELAAILCLPLPTISAIGSITAASLFAIYALAMAMVLLAGRHEIECGCGGEGQVVSWALVARNGVLGAISASIPLPTSNRAMSWPDMLVGVAATFLVFLLLAIAEKAIGTFAAIRRLGSGSH